MKNIRSVLTAAIVKAAIRFGDRKTLLGMSDRIERLGGIGSNLIPPKEMWAAYGSANLFESALAHFKYFLDFGGLNRDASVLDIGCSIGRMAYPLTAYLNADARYEGFDIVPSSIEYCQTHISPSFPNFTFQLADIFNAYYNPNGRSQPDKYRFPYDDAQFDLIFSTSVFTHLKPGAIQNYLNETARVLKPGGFALNTFLLIDDQTLGALERGETKVRLPYEREGYRVGSRKAEEAVVAVDESTVRELHKESGLTIVEPILRGHWRHKEVPARTYYKSAKGYYAYQDMVVATR